ncbi:MAG: hypothetical protein ACK5IQ_01850 [Bacteroidales bacterium]
MKIIAILMLWITLECTSYTPKTTTNNFVKVENGAFSINGKPYTFKGANYWQGMNLGAPKSGDSIIPPSNWTAVLI